MSLNNKYKLLVVNDFFDRSEAALMIGLTQAGVHVDVICNPKSGNQEILLQGGIHLEHLLIRHRLDLHAIKFLGHKLKSEKYDVIYAPKNNCLSTSIQASKGHLVKVTGYRGMIGKIRYLNPGSWLTYLHPRVDKIVCVCKSVQNYLESMHIPSEKLITIYKGHDLSWYQETEHLRLSDFQIPKDAFVVGFVGNIRWVKGVDVLLDAILHHIPPSLNIYFIIIGEIRDIKIHWMKRNKLLQDRVRFTGYRQNAYNIMKTFDIFVMPSVLREGLCRAVIEAMAQQIPPIVSNVGGLPELVVDGESGWIVPPRDPKKLAEAIVRRYNNEADRLKMGYCAKKRIEEKFNINHTIAQTIQMHLELLGRNG